MGQRAGEDVNRDYISSHAANDEWHHWNFERNSRLPRGTFDESISASHWFYALAAAVAVALIICWSVS